MGKYQRKRHFDDFSGTDEFAESVDEMWETGCRNSGKTHQAVHNGYQKGSYSVIRTSQTPPSCTNLQQISTSAVRRTKTTRDDCHGDCLQTKSAYCRRTHNSFRCNGSKGNYCLA